MQAANWRHLYYFPFNQLYSGMPGEHTSFCHTVKFRDIEELSMWAIRIPQNRGRLSDIVHPLPPIFNVVLKLKICGQPL